MKAHSTPARHQRIMTLLRDHGELKARELSRVLGVTPMTVWRDLQRLGEQGLLRRVRGGARFLGDLVVEPDFEAKTSAADQAKSRIAVAAVSEFVREGDVIAMEGGTTVAALVDALPDQHISVVTNSLPIALRMRARRPVLPVRVLGGWLSAVSGNTTGPEALKSAALGRTSVCFLGATGWDAERGPMDPNPLEIEVKRALAACSERVVLLMDSRKFHLASASVMMHPRRLHALVTDAPPPAAIARHLESEGVRVVVAAKQTEEPLHESRRKNGSRMARYSS
jgi:DeoR/GlpR family transcriptional regulator of sugar metabolism